MPHPSDPHPTSGEPAPASSGSAGSPAARRPAAHRSHGSHRSRLLGRFARALGVIVVLVLLAACSSPADDEADGPVELGPAISTPERGTFPPGTTVRLMAHDSWSVSDDVLEQFTDATGIEVEVVLGGDAVAMVNQAILSAGNPQADVLYGIDDNLLARAAQAQLFTPYEADGLDTVDDAFTAGLDGQVTPIDYGDVCVNYDRRWFAGEGLPLPQSLEDLADPSYKDLLVVEDPTRSTPGLAFLLASIAEVGGGDDTGDTAPWRQWWQLLQANGVKVVDSWEIAYYTEFSGSSGAGPRPLVVSYASSPPVEVTDPSISPEEAPTGVLADTCYRQVEYAGVLRGASNPEAAAALIDFLLSIPFQEDVPEQMYVFPVSNDATLPSAWQKFVEPVDEPLQLDPADVAANQDRWLQQWSSLFR
jgi:thiamine transport system substrate-binding protein